MHTTQLSCIRLSSCLLLEKSNRYHGLIHPQEGFRRQFCVHCDLGSILNIGLWDN